MVSNLWNNVRRVQDLKKDSASRVEIIDIILVGKSQRSSVYKKPNGTRATAVGQAEVSMAIHDPV